MKIPSVMGLLPPGSVPWLIAHEVRLGWRGMGGNRKSDKKKQRVGAARIFMIGLAAFAILSIVSAGIGLGFAAAYFPLPRTPFVALIAAVGAVLILSLMVSQAMNLTIQALYERGDMDLLMSSPLRPRTILTVRAISIAVVTSLLWVGLTLSFIVTASVLGRPEWLGLLVVLLGLAMLATVGGILVTMGLFRLIGPRATRTTAQILAGVTGGIVFLASQVANLNRNSRDNDPGPVMDMARSLIDTGRFNLDQPLSLIARAITGDILAVALFAGVAIAGLLAVTIGLAPRFARNATEVVGLTSRKVSTRKADKPFAEGLNAVLVRKELRLLARDPQLLSHIVLRLVYMLPLGFILYRQAESGALPAAGGAGIVFLAGQLAGSFAWITLSAEDTPDLLTSAPVDRSKVDRAKLIAAMVPTMALTLIAISAFSVYLPLAGLIVLIGCLCSATSSGLIQLWQQKPSERKMFNNNKRGSVLVNLVEFLVQGLWGGATALTIIGQVWAVIPAVLAIGITLALRRPPRVRYRAV